MVCEGIKEKIKGATTARRLRPLKLSRKVSACRFRLVSADLPLSKPLTPNKTFKPMELFGSIASAAAVRLLRPLN
jgi:hypothetical protein